MAGRVLNVLPSYVVEFAFSLTLDVDAGMIFNNVGTVFRDFVPIDNVPPVAHVLGSAVVSL